MKVDVYIFLIVLLVNYILALAYMLIQYVRVSETKGSFVLRGFVMLLFPVVGPIFYGFGYLFKRLMAGVPIDFSEVMFSKERVATYSGADEENEKDFVSLEDAIAVADTANLRKLMLNVVRRDVSDSLAAISQALNANDSETSHYAAALLQEALDGFRSSVTGNYSDIVAAIEELDKMENNTMIHQDEMYQDVAELARTTFVYMDPVLKQHVFTEVEQESLVNLMDKIGDIVYEYVPHKLTAEDYEAVAMRLMEIQEYDKCEKWCNRADYFYPDVLSTYASKLKLYFALNKKKRFFEVLDDLKHSDVIVDNETLELIRVFS